MDGDLAELGDGLDQASQARQLPDPWLAVAGDEGNNQANSALYLRALGARLASLGYLTAEAAKREQLTPELSAAIRAFQQDAGFSGADVDGWAGPQTKRRLQQLVSFEEEQSPAQWGELGRDPTAYPAVGRAVYLRLYCLGFLPDAPALSATSECQLAHNPALRDGLGRFLASAQALGLAVADTTPRLDTTVLELLYGHDALIAALADHPGFIDDPANDGFVNAIARVELWLLGYDVALGPSQPLVRRPQGSHGPHNVPDYVWMDPVAEALADFTEKFPEARSALPNRRFSTAFFAQLAALDAADDEDHDPALVDALLARAAKHSNDLMDKLGQLASRLWDGAKRLWAWLKRAVRGVWQRLEDELWNLARFIAKGARESFVLVTQAIDIVHRGAVYLRGTCFPGSDPTRAVLGYDHDFDARLLLATGAGTAAALNLVQQDAAETPYFTAACRIVGLTLAALRDTASTLAVGAVAWFTVLLALTRIAADLRAIGATVQGLADYNTGAATLYANPVR
ncbi:hypothetical protein DLREEDagrD3_11000 [Denitratisoma sp. agr-D3]